MPRGVFAGELRNLPIGMLRALVFLANRRELAERPP